MSQELTITFNGATASCVYDDALAETLDVLGVVTVTRASHVEPAPGGGWTADMSPVAPGVVLGPFRLRAEALAAEREWLRKNLSSL
jgi:hypothetical protein